ncbi:LysR substrate-binding domain-containing protein [Roseovarius sp. C7]|uniref:LysR substrate-binding domain-containing protein n=1 Tax=Roseovarius sp. C7 TaxID=3398643 RepID=UPI0039F4F770
MEQLPNLNGLRAFEAAGRHLTFRAAAEELGVTQGAVAQQVRQLEAVLGLALFDRLPKGLALSEAGRGYHGRVAGAFQELRAATAALRPEPGQVTISVTPSFAAKWLIPNMSGLAEAHPEIDLRILATEKLSSFHGGGIDLAVRQGQPPFGASLEARLLFRQELIAVAAPGLLGAEGADVSSAQLARLPKLRDAHGLWPAFLSQLGVAEDSGRGLGLSQTALAIDAARAGQGVALVSRFLVARDLADGSLLQVTDTVMRGAQDFYLLAQRGRRSELVAAVMGWLVATAEAQAGAGA